MKAKYEGCILYELCGCKQRMETLFFLPGLMTSRFSYENDVHQILVEQDLL
jgi:hypothetical protein